MADSLKGKLTKRLVEAVMPPSAGEIRVWDTEVRGFMLRVTASGRRSYAIKYRFNGEQRWWKIGDHGRSWTADAARTRAMEIVSDARMGRDPQFGAPTVPSLAPASDLDDEQGDTPIAAGLGDDAPTRPGAMRDATVSDLYELYLREGPTDKPLKRASSWEVDRTSYRSHVKPLIGSAIARRLRPTDLAAFQAAVAEGKSAADRRTGHRGRSMVRGGTGAAVRAMRALSAMFSWAVWREFMESNPALRVKKLPAPTRDRPITTEEARRLWSVLQEAQSAWVIAPAHADMIRLVMLTGARRNEIAQLAWSEVDFEHSRLVLPPVRTKMGVLNKARTIVLSEPAREILERQPRRAEHVFPARVDGKAMDGINKAWLKARALAGLDDVRLHDLRHSFATFAVEDGASLFLVGKALGHRNAVSTERYAHPRDASAHEIARRIAERILSTGGEPPTAPERGAGPEPATAAKAPSACAPSVHLPTPIDANLPVPANDVEPPLETLLPTYAPWLT